MCLCLCVREREGGREREREKRSSDTFWSFLDNEKHAYMCVLLTNR